jgi:hypothetical protein
MWGTGGGLFSKRSSAQMRAGARCAWVGELTASKEVGVWYLSLAKNRISCQSQMGALTHSLHCACRFYTHTSPQTPLFAWGWIHCIAPFSFTHTPAPDTLGLWGKPSEAGDFPATRSLAGTCLPKPGYGWWRGGVQLLSDHKINVHKQLWRKVARQLRKKRCGVQLS